MNDSLVGLKHTLNNKANNIVFITPYQYCVYWAIKLSIYSLLLHFTQWSNSVDYLYSDTFEKLLYSILLYL